MFEPRGPRQNGGSTGTKSTTKKQRSNRERQPNSEQFLFHYATLKDILG
ncbi:unnamed protein product [Porites lobata]|uniref:Uncharacterized protein n=1 Tax=Porites lobata TaxID=104759 RepID=A0ABN8MPW8_9CNID|nr:unnamed protein product [Porites lobata]